MLSIAAVTGLFFLLALLGMSFEVYLEKRYIATEWQSRTTHLLVLYLILSYLIYHFFL